MNTKALLSGRLMAAVVTSFAILLGLAAVARAETRTVGADLSTPVSFTGECTDSGGCGALFLGATSPSTSTASPISGTVVRWRIKGASATPGYVVNVMRKNADGTYTVTASSAPVTPLGTSDVETFTTSLSIQAGEYVEWNIPHEGGITILEAPSTEGFFEPAPAPGQTATPTEEEVPFTLGLNADIETPSVVTPVVAPVAPVTTPAPVAAVPTCKVPNLKGKKLSAAKKALRRADCKVGSVTKKKGVTAKTGKVVKESPKAGVTRTAGSKVNLKLG